ncbi:hypothetical protein BKI52_18065 [marine bacterium AO1-C]|nr:hypothetical protein BKI52_18065 [marine bacterium AO1-C]
MTDLTEGVSGTKATFKTAKIYLNETSNVLIVESLRSYILIEEFKEIFDKVNELIAEYKVTKFIFDKRKLKVFHQPSMEWYFVEWKESAYDLGLKTIRKILPEDGVFRQSVKIGITKIKNEYPEAKFHLMDIQYSNTLEDALKELT